MSKTPTRRRMLQGMGSVAGLVLTGCSATSGQTELPLQQGAVIPGARSNEPAFYEAAYAARPSELFPLPAVPFEKIDPAFYRRVVDDPTGAPAGSVMVDKSRHFLFLVQKNGKAIRYGVGLGRAGFDWAGRGVIQYKRKWPRWTPPDEMVRRQPELEPYSIANGGMAPGIRNPLGARALYIFQNGEDTLYRIHGTPEWWSIGKSVSSGCVRMLNQDVIDLFDRVANQSSIIVSQ